MTTFIWFSFGVYVVTIVAKVLGLLVLPYPLPRKPVQRGETWVGIVTSIAMATWAWIALHGGE